LIEAVIHNSQVCRLALSVDDMPYIVPLCFGYHENTIYAHGALKGKKIDMIRKNPNVCFEFDIHVEIAATEKACNWGVKYQSVIGFGQASLVEDFEEKRKALGIIMGQYSDRSFRLSESALKGTAIIKIEITSMTGKKSE